MGPVLLGGVVHGVDLGGAHRGAVTLAGVVASNSRSRAVLEQKVDELSRRVEKHNCLVERTYRLERDVALVRRDVESLEERAGK